MDPAIFIQHPLLVLAIALLVVGLAHVVIVRLMMGPGVAHSDEQSPAAPTREPQEDANARHG